MTQVELPCAGPSAQALRNVRIGIRHPLADTTLRSAPRSRLGEGSRRIGRFRLACARVRRYPCWNRRLGGAVSRAGIAIGFGVHDRRHDS